MSVLGLMENTADIAQTTPDLSALPSTNTERMGAAWDAAQSPDRYWNAQKARHAGAEKIIDDLHAMTGERVLNPFDAGPTQAEIKENPNWSLPQIQAQRLQVLREKTRAAKAGLEQLGGLPQDYLDVDSIDASIAQESGARRARDERMSGTGGGLGGFLGSMAGETVSPHGIMTSFIPVTRMGTAVAEAGVAAFAKNVAKEALFQGGTQAAAQSLATIVDYNTRKQFGTEQTNEQILDEIISAGAGGALLGGAFRAAHLGILKLASRGVEIPPAVLDAARVMEEGDLYGNKNPLRINPGQLEVATDQATSAAALGRAASPDVDVNPTQTLHEAARRLEPELMRRYDAAVSARDEIRAQLAPDDATITKLKERADAADAAIAAAGPQTGEAAERLGASARMAHLVHDDAVARKAAMEGGQAPVTGAAPAPSSTGLGELGGAAKAMTGNLYEGLFGALEKGETKFAGITDPVLAAARADFEAGRIKNPQDLADFVNKRGAFAAAPAETTVSRSLRQQLMAADQELRDLLPEINRVMKQAGEEVTAATRAADEFLARGKAAEEAAPLARLSEEEISRVRELQDQIPEYERMRDQAATPEDKAAWQQAIDDFHAEIAKIMDLDIADQAPVKAAMERMKATPDNPMQAPRPNPPEPKPQPTTAKLPGESAEDKAVLQQAQQVLDSKTAAVVDPNLRRTMELAEVEESQAAAAVACLAGAI